MEYFFVALEESALALNEFFALKPICLKEGVCKCAVPVSEIKKYMDAMIYLGFSFIIYDYNKANPAEEKIELLYEHVGKEKLNEIMLRLKWGIIC